MVVGCAIGHRYAVSGPVNPCCVLLRYGSFYLPKHIIVHRSTTIRIKGTIVFALPNPNSPPFLLLIGGDDRMWHYASIYCNGVGRSSSVLLLDR